MKRWYLIFLSGILCVTLTSGCGKKKTTKTSDQLAALEESAIKGEDIPLESVPEGDFIEPDEAGISGVFSDVYFDYDKSQIRQADYPTLNKIGNWMQKNTDKSVMIEGHCDERGSAEYNMALGEQRALSIRRYLIGLGVNSSNLYTVSYGEEKPADPGHNESAWTKNRRGHFLVSK